MLNDISNIVYNMTTSSVQPVPKAAYRSDFRENTNFCPQRDSKLGPLAQMAGFNTFDYNFLFGGGRLTLATLHNVKPRYTICQFYQTI